MRNDSLINTEADAANNSQDTQYVVKYTIRSVLIFLLMLVCSFAIWCYAHYLKDPIVDQQFLVEFELKNANTNEYVSPIVITLRGLKSEIECIGEESFEIDNLRRIVIEVDKNDFIRANSTTISIPMPHSYQAYTEEECLYLQLLIMELPNDQGTDK